jgi:predicted ABC-type ATPase
MDQHSRSVSVVAGPNGAGKSTFVENYLNRYVDCDEFLNADLIARGLSPFAPERQSLRASEIFLQRLGELEAGKGVLPWRLRLRGATIAGAFRAGKNLGFTLPCSLSGYQVTKWPYSELHRGWLKADTILLFPISGGDTLEG